ncbi:hypothetical protein Lfu02_14990 [Longispora fulva]|uniref:Uncharacterized protein n=1 Tax=Longispora fulva TaxID=619741 RepID=A0A8J7GYE6_9ACTN|nr:hypothetical protein [Longispora fulva]MBG6140491.1 hypothetical protein [Longispora fulva]GIG57127.1 hypothetical protein Lfu02_14990 [Longispora fulva]
MTQPIRGVHDEYGDPLQEASRAPISNAVVATSFLEALARWQHSRAQDKAEQAERAAANDRKTAEQDRKFVADLARSNSVREAAGRLVYERAFEPGFMQQADLRTLGETWAAAEAQHRYNPRAREAMERVEDRLFDAIPAHMVQYDVWIDQGVPPRDAMARVFARVDNVTPPPAETARPTRDRAGALEGPQPEIQPIATPDTPAAGAREDRGAVVLVGGVSDHLIRPPVEPDELARLRAEVVSLHRIDRYLEATSGPEGISPQLQQRQQLVHDNLKLQISRLEVLLAPAPETVTLDQLREEAKRLTMMVNLRQDYLNEMVTEYVTRPDVAPSYIEFLGRKVDQHSANLRTIEGELLAEPHPGRADNERKKAAYDMTTPDLAATSTVDEHAQGVIDARRHLGVAEQDTAAPRSAPQLAMESFPTPAAADVAAAKAKPTGPAPRPRKAAAPAPRPATPNTGG